MTVTIQNGSGIWAYWLDREKALVIADRIYQPTAAHFAGRLNCSASAGMQAELAEQEFPVPEKQDPCVFSDRFPRFVEMKEK